DSAYLGVHKLALAGVQPGSHVDSEVFDRLRDCRGATDRTRRPVEAGEETVAGRVELRAAEAGQLAADQRVVLAEQLAPARIAQLRGFRGRADDVREEHCREHSVGLRVTPRLLLPDLLQEALDLAQ